MNEFDYPEESLRSRLQRVSGVDPRIGAGVNGPPQGSPADLVRSRLQQIPGTADPRIAAATPQPTGADILRERLQQVGTQPNPRLTTPVNGPPQAGPADLLRERIRQIPGTADPRVATPLNGPPQSYAGAPAGESAPASSIRQWVNSRFATPGAQTPGNALDAGKRLVQGAGNIAGKGINQLNSGGKTTAVGRGLGAVQAGLGVNELLNEGITARGIDNTLLGAATAINPGLGAIGNLARMGRDVALEQGVNLAYKDRTAGPALSDALGGLTPEQYLAKRKAGATNPATPPATPAATTVPPPIVPGIDEAPTLLRTGRGSRGNNGASGAPTRPGPQLLGSDDDEVEVIYGNRGSVLHRFGPNGEIQQINVSPGHIAHQTVDKQVSDHLAAGQSVPTDLIKSYYLAHGLDPKDILKDETTLEGEKIKAGSAENVANIGAGAVKYKADTDATLLREGSKEKLKDTRFPHMRKIYDQYGQVIGEEPVVTDLATGATIGSSTQANRPTPSAAAIERLTRLSKKGADPAEVQLFESRYGQGSAAQYLQGAKPKGYKKGGLIRRYARGGPVGDERDYQPSDTPEDYALRNTEPDVAANSAFGQPAFNYTANPAFGKANPAFGKPAINYTADPAFSRPIFNYAANPAFGHPGAIQEFGHGGPVRGPGTGTSDSIPALVDGVEPAALSTDEYVIPAAVVKRKGKQFFDNLLAEDR